MLKVTFFKLNENCTVDICLHDEENLVIVSAKIRLRGSDQLLMVENYSSLLSLRILENSNPNENRKIKKVNTKISNYCDENNLVFYKA